MPSLIRVATSVCAAVSAAALSFHLTNKPAQTEQKRPLQNRANHDASETRPAFSEGFVGMVGNTPLVITLDHFHTRC
jgi:peptidoglycan/LPS O-acetylase OafA/YrhL